MIHVELDWADHGLVSSKCRQWKTKLFSQLFHPLNKVTWGTVVCQWKGPWHEKVLKTTFVDHCIDICYVLKSIIQAFLLISRPSVLGTDGTASAIWRTWKPLMTSAAISDTHLCQSNPTPSRLWVAFSSATFWYVTIVPGHAEDLWQSLGLRYQPQGLGLDPIKDQDQEEMSDLKSVPAHKDMVYDIT